MAGQTKMFQDGAAKITQAEVPTVIKFLEALTPGMLYVKCGLCHKFKQALTSYIRTVAHPTEPNTRLQIQICEECNYS